MDMVFDFDQRQGLANVALIGITVIVLLPRLLSLLPVIITLAALGALANGVKNIIG